MFRGRARALTARVERAIAAIATPATTSRSGGAREATRRLASTTAREDDVGRDDDWLAARKRWKAEVNEMRKAWRREFDEKSAEKAKAEEVARAEVAEAKAERLAEKARARAARAGASARTLEELKREKDRKMRVIAGRRYQRAHAMSLRRQAREVDLLKQSRDWIDTPEALEASIERAMAHPERLFK